MMVGLKIIEVWSDGVLESAERLARTRSWGPYGLWKDLFVCFFKCSRKPWRILSCGLTGSDLHI